MLEKNSPEKARGRVLFPDEVKFYEYIQRLSTGFLHSDVFVCVSLVSRNLNLVVLNEHDTILGSLTETILMNSINSRYSATRNPFVELGNSSYFYFTLSQ